MSLGPMQEYALRGLDKTSIENLALGRITRMALSQAARRARQRPEFVIEGVGACLSISTIEDMILADELNDMLEAARAWKLEGNERG